MSIDRREEKTDSRLPEVSLGIATPSHVACAQKGENHIGAWLNSGGAELGQTTGSAHCYKIIGT